MQYLVDYAWPGNVRELRNLVESMVVLSPGHEIMPQDLPRQIRDGGTARYLPVHVGPILRGEDSAAGRELEFILRSLLDLKLQVEELRRRLDEHPQRVQVIELGDHTSVADVLTDGDGADRDQEVVYRSGMTMADVEKAAIEAALREYRGNRRRAAEVLGIGERTLYRKIKAYHLE